MKTKELIRNKGITLIALVITIIVLLILAGVTIATLTGENGILTRATEASEKTNYAGAKETIEMEAMGGFDNTGRYSVDLAKENLENHTNATVTENIDGTLYVQKDGYNFDIDENGNVSVATRVSAGYNHSLAIDEEGNLYAWGRNDYGQLGDGTTNNSGTPIQIMEGTKFKEVSAGTYCSLAIDEDGNLYAWGRYYWDSFGGESIVKNTPTLIQEDTKFIKVSNGVSTSQPVCIAIDEEGNLWGWGENTLGTLGTGTKESSSVPVRIKEGTKFKKISVGGGHSLAIDIDNNLWSWGFNNVGQLGNNSSATAYEPIQIMQGTKIKEIIADGQFSLAIDETGTLWSWGNNFRGALGNGTTTSGYEVNGIPNKVQTDRKFKKISGGSANSFGIDTENNLWAWGFTSSGRLGIGETDNTEVTLPTIVKEGTKFKEISGGSSHTLAIDEEGNLWSWGSNGNGELGNGTTNSSNVPIKIKLK